MPIIETPRLSLRAMAIDDADNLLGIFGDPVAMQYYSSTKDRAATLNWIAWIHRSYEEDGIGLWIVEDRVTGAFLGECGLTMQEVEGVCEPEVGYHFLSSVWGHGYATEAAAACLDYGFQQRDYARIICIPAATNVPSRRVAERLGMRLERELIRRGKPICVYAKEREKS